MRNKDQKQMTRQEVIHRRMVEMGVEFIERKRRESDRLQEREHSIKKHNNG